MRLPVSSPRKIFYLPYGLCSSVDTTGRADVGGAPARGRAQPSHR